MLATDDQYLHDTSTQYGLSADTRGKCMDTQDLERAISLLKAGRKVEAQHLLQPALRLNPSHEAAWLWYVDTLSTDAERVVALKLCLTFNPNSKAARQGVEVFSQRESKRRMETATTKSPTSKPVSPQQSNRDRVQLPADRYDESGKRTKRRSDEDISNPIDRVRRTHEDFYCEECGCTLTKCRACSGFFCEDCQEGRCDLCGESVHNESEEELRHDGFHIVEFRRVLGYFGDKPDYEEVRED